MCTLLGGAIIPFAVTTFTQERCFGCLLLDPYTKEVISVVSPDQNGSEKPGVVATRAYMAAENYGGADMYDVLGFRPDAKISKPPCLEKMKGATCLTDDEFKLFVSHFDWCVGLKAPCAA